MEDSKKVEVKEVEEKKPGIFKRVISNKFVQIGAGVISGLFIGSMLQAMMDDETIDELELTEDDLLVADLVADLAALPDDEPQETE